MTKEAPNKHDMCLFRLPLSHLTPCARPPHPPPRPPNPPSRKLERGPSVSLWPGGSGGAPGFSTQTSHAGQPEPQWLPPSGIPETQILWSSGSEKLQLNLNTAQVPEEPSRIERFIVLEIWLNPDTPTSGLFWVFNGSSPV